MSELEKAARVALEQLEDLMGRVPFAHYIKVTSELRSALDKQSTHGEGCWSWGPTHYECACKEIAKMKGWK
jgi:hypothetical protein